MLPSSSACVVSKITHENKLTPGDVQQNRACGGGCRGAAPHTLKSELHRRHSWGSYQFRFEQFSFVLVETCQVVTGVFVDCAQATTKEDKELRT